MSYVTLADLKAYAGITTAGDDALLTQMLAAAQAEIDSYCHQPFEALADTTRYFDPLRDTGQGGGYGYYSYGAGRTLYLDYPLCAITSVTNGDGVVIAATNYVTEPRNMTPFFALSLKLTSSVLWTYTSSPENSVAIVGKWAYSVTADANIQQATKRLATWYYRGRDNALDLDRAVIVGNATIAPTRIPMDVMTLLESYKRLVI
jgi:Phage gp6-like head-tail connector protein